MHQGRDLTSIATNSEKFSDPKATCPLVRAPTLSGGLERTQHNTLAPQVRVCQRYKLRPPGKLQVSSKLLHATGAERTSSASCVDTALPRPQPGPRLNRLIWIVIRKRSFFKVCGLLPTEAGRTNFREFPDNTRSVRVSIQCNPVQPQ